MNCSGEGRGLDCGSDCVRIMVLPVLEIYVYLYERDWWISQGLLRMWKEFSANLDREAAMIMPSFLYARRVRLARYEYRRAIFRRPRILVVYPVMCTSSRSSLLSGLLDALRSSIQRAFLAGLRFRHLFASLLVFARVSMERCVPCGPQRQTCLLLELVCLVIFVFLVLDLLLWLLVVNRVRTGWERALLERVVA